MKLKPHPYSELMGSRISVMQDGERIAMLDVRIIRQGMHTIAEASENVVTFISELEHRHNQACERIFDMLQQDDGEAFQEAEKFLRAHRPDLYNKIGQTKDML